VGELEDVFAVAAFPHAATTIAKDATARTTL
jgi:hypothetical protein